MARAHLALTAHYGRGAGRVIIGAAERAGYQVQEVRRIGTGERRLLLHGRLDRAVPPPPVDQ
ncbi:hypothetical protein DFJ69_6133 [Thermomonospora umbrina]|uniref:Uncharacterized protein n=1 Tax=Thermomonospora umbrina TaxID=111806 RepID=A0A3D9T9Y1_9ACTN|nr:hypothetical protein DFJ69_6133 [Thermomonospora umbrina]